MRQRNVRITLTILLALAFTLSGLLAVPQHPVQAQAEHVAGELLVRFNPLATEAAREALRGELGARLERRYHLVQGMELLRLPNGMSVATAIERLQGRAEVLYAQPNFIYHIENTPNDPSLGLLWGMSNIRATTAWDTYNGDGNFVIAVIDTGIAYNHPDLVDNLWVNPGEIAGNLIDDDGNGYVDDIYGYDFAYGDSDPWDGHSHGTHTSGTIGARGNNATGVVGVNWQIKIMALKMFTDAGSGDTADAISAMEYAVDKGVKVSNNSWGGGAFDQGLYDAIQGAQSIGHLFVAAAGNNYGNNNDNNPYYPASYNLPNIIAVAAIDSNDNLASFSNFGRTTVDLGAPGVDIYSSVPGGYGYMSGTSMATPHVAGAAALLYGLHPGWTFQQIKDQLMNTARPIPALTNKTVTNGTLDLAAAVGAEPPPPPPGNTMHLGGLNGSSSVYNSRQWQAMVTITVHDADHNPVSNATVRGRWTGAFRDSSCTTNSSGQCSLTKNATNRKASIAFTVSSITHSTLTYQSSSNDVGTSVTVNKP